MFWKKKKEKTIEEREEMIAEMTYETARGSFDYPHGYTLTLEDLDELQARYAHWKDNSSGEGEHNWQFMQRAYHLLSTPLIKVAWDQFPPSSITLRQALKVFGNEPYDEPSNEDVPKQHDLNHRFGYLSRHGLSTIEDAERLDAAYHALYEHSKPSGYMNPEPIEPPCLLRFKNVIAKEKAAGWESPKVGKWEITDKEAHAVFGIEDVGKFLPLDVTEMFKERQARCTSVEDAEKLDLAYRWLFTLSCRYEKDFTVSIASPYAPILAKKLGQPLPVMAQTQQKEVTRASELPVGFPPDPAPLSIEEQKDEFIQDVWNHFQSTKDLYADAKKLLLPDTCTNIVETAKIHLKFLENLRKRLTPEVQDQVVEEDEVTKTPVLPLVEEVAQPEEAAPVPVYDLSVEEALRVFVLERNDEFDEEELTARYKDKSAITDSKAAQVKIDTAYEVLKAHLEKKVAYQTERSKFDFGLTETITVKELTYRYKLASEKTDSKAEQKALDEAYQVLLKIAV